LGDIRHIYAKSDTLQKREFVNMVFDGNLYYQEGTYRTPTMLDMLSHNASKMEEKGILYIKKRDNLKDYPSKWGDRGFGTPTSRCKRGVEPAGIIALFTRLLSFPDCECKYKTLFECATINEKN
jgi:hypothetical protein